MRVIALRGFFQGPAEVSEGALDVAGVQGDRRRVDGFGRGLRTRRPPSGLPLADLKVEPGSFDQLALAWIPLNDTPEAIGGGFEVVALERANPRLVHRERLVEGWPTRRRGRSRDFLGLRRLGRQDPHPRGHGPRAGAFIPALGLGGRLNLRPSVEGFEALAPLESVSAFGAFRLTGVDFFATGRAGDRLAAARRCFGMQCWPGSFGPRQ